MFNFVLSIYKRLGSLIFKVKFLGGGFLLNSRITACQISYHQI